MCGIVGIISVKEIPKFEERLHKMVLSLKHRGPDIQKVEVIETGKIGMGHSRLKIIDLSDEANQPMASTDGNLILSFNGEIYNYKEIRGILEGKGIKFKTNSDTEVILAAVEIYGFKWFVERANGMFSIALFDRKKMKLYLCRDRLGIKPLYYTMDRYKLIFSSEVKGILNSGLVDANMNSEAIDTYLAFRYIISPETLFEGIYMVESGTIMEFDLNKERIKLKSSKYWNLPSLNKSNHIISTKEENRIKSLLNEKLYNAVKYRMISDVPFGAYLSGGVDSSIIVALMAKISKVPIKTYTIGFEEEDFNEFYYARKVAEKYKTNHHEILLSAEKYMEEWQKLIEYKDAPLSVPNEIPLAVMSRELKKDITVVLSGEGADELFGGYGRIYRLPFVWENKKDVSKNFSKEDEFKFFIHTYEYVPEYIRDVFLASEEYFADRKSLHKRLFYKYFSEYNFQEAIFRFFESVHLQGLLQRLDVTTMQTSVEGRVPFVDHELVEFAYERIPLSLKLKWKNKISMKKAKNLPPSEFSETLDTPKYILKKLSLDYLPVEVVFRKKMGFPVPLDIWLREELTSIAQQRLRNSVFIKKDSSIDELIGSSSKVPRSGQILWMFVNLEIWREKYFRKSWRW